MRHRNAFMLLALLATQASCSRETRDFHPPAAESEAVRFVRLTDYVPGGEFPEQPGTLALAPQEGRA